MASEWALKQRAIQPRKRWAVDQDDKPIIREPSARPSRARPFDKVKRRIRRSFG